jgi:hypothetical protein
MSNPLLNNLKYNPDVVGKYQTFKSFRERGYSIPQTEKPQKIQVAHSEGDLRKQMTRFNQERQMQNAQIQQIYSNQNRYRNKQIFDERQAEINKVTEIMSKGSTSIEMKQESVKYNKQFGNLTDELRRFFN